MFWRTDIFCRFLGFLCGLEPDKIDKIDLEKSLKALINSGEIYPASFNSVLARIVTKSV